MDESRGWGSLYHMGGVGYPNRYIPGVTILYIVSSVQFDFCLGLGDYRLLLFCELYIIVNVTCHSNIEFVMLCVGGIKVITGL